MEVHAHTHTSGKKWFHYLWEFLMLFLAVFCGFLAENLREHQIEKNRENQFMQTMVEDLKSDTAQLSRIIRGRKSRIRELDTLFDLIASDEYLKEGRKVYELYENPYWDILRFFPSDRTMQQLKNGGNLRLIRNKEVSNALINYDVWVRNRKEYEPLQAELASGMNQYLEKLLDPEIIDNSTRAYTHNQLAADTIVSGRDRTVLPANITILKLAEPDKKAILKYLNQIKTIYLGNMRDNISEKELAEKTLALITVEYHIN